jgi:hypothetical protein
LQWFHSQPVETVQNWNALMRAFMKEYCDNPTRDNFVLSPKPLHLVIKR